MEPMTWIAVFNLVAQVGIPAAEALIAKWSSGEPATPENVTAALADAKAMGALTPQDILKRALEAKGIALTDPKAVELLKLVGA